MDKLKMTSPDLADEKYRKLAELFPNAVTEIITTDAMGRSVVKRAIDKDVLAQEINKNVVGGVKERYQFTWPEKKRAMILANEPTTKTLRLDREKSMGKDGTPGAIDTENIYIEGDNLEALKIIRETYLGKVKMIYIDPPYNTGNDLIYNDDYRKSQAGYKEQSGLFDAEGNRNDENPSIKNLVSNGRFHTDWLNMIYPRLKVAKDLLAQDGVIFISIDDSEQANLKKVCDEIFGDVNFIAQIIWEKRYTRSNNAKRFTTLTESVILYAKNINCIEEIKEKRNNKANSIYSNPDNDPRGPWTSVSYVNPASKQQRPNLSYILKNPITGNLVEHPTNAWKYEKATYERHVKERRLYWGKNGENTYPRLKKFLSEMDGEMVPVDLWRQEDTGTTDQASKELESLLGRKIFDFPKPKELIIRIISLIINNDKNKKQLILDFFSGSATTAHAVMQLNAEDGGHRKYIMVQLPEKTDEKSEAYKAGYKTICEIGEERIRRAGQKIKEDVAAHNALVEAKEKKKAEQGSLFKEEIPPKQQVPDIGFRVFRVDTSNMNDVYYTPDEYRQDEIDLFETNVKEGRTPDDLLFQSMLDLGVNLSSPISEKVMAGKTVFIVGDAAHPYLTACFDEDVTEDTAKEMALLQPQYAVFQDSSMKSDSAAVNVDQIFALYSSGTERRMI